MPLIVSVISDTVGLAGTAGPLALSAYSSDHDAVPVLRVRYHCDSMAVTDLAADVLPMSG